MTGRLDDVAGAHSMPSDVVVIGLFGVALLGMIAALLTG